jgi:hypothetical protein
VVMASAHTTRWCDLAWSESAFQARNCFTYCKICFSGDRQIVSHFASIPNTMRYWVVGRWRVKPVKATNCEDKVASIV